MRELSLFSGAGGGLLGSKLLGWTSVGYVEFNDYCQRVIRQRIDDGIFDNAPIFGDIKAFNSEGYAASYTGLVDVVSAGFPYQPFSVAGRRAAENDERNMWHETIRTIRTVRPRFALLENVPGLLSTGYFERVCGDLVESGYDCRWRVLSAAEVGAPHKRDRLWIVAYKGDVSDTGCSRRKEQHVTTESSIQGHDTGTFAQARRATWWATEPELGRVAHRVANRVDRLKAIGNGQVPFCMAAAFKILFGEVI